MGASCCTNEMKQMQASVQFNNINNTQETSQKPIIRQSNRKEKMPSKQNVLSPPSSLIIELIDNSDIWPNDLDSIRHRDNQHNSHDHDDIGTPGFQTAQFINSKPNHKEKVQGKASIQFIKEVNSDKNEHVEKDLPSIKKYTKQKSMLNQENTLGNSPVQIFVSQNSLVKMASDSVKLRTKSADNTQMMQQQPASPSGERKERESKEMKSSTTNKHITRSQSQFKESTRRSPYELDDQKSLRSENTKRSILKKKETSQFKKRETIQEKSFDTHSMNSRRVRFDAEVDRPKHKKQTAKFR